MLIGRERELADLRLMLDTDKSEFVAVYGRRRVGKSRTGCSLAFSRNLNSATS